MRLGLHVEVAGDGKQSVEHLPDRQLAHRFSAHRLADRAQRRREFLDAMIVGDILRLEMDFGHAAVIACGQPIEDLGEPVARLPVDPPHDTEIDRRDRPVGLHEQIALVHVGVEEPLGDRLPQKGVDQIGRQLFHVVARRDQRLAVRNLDPVDPVERHDARRGAVPVDRGHFVGRLGRHCLAQLGRRRGFAAQVELAQRPAPEIGDHLPRPQPRGFAAQCLEMRGRPFIGFDVARELLVDAGAANLDRDLPAVGGHRAVNLRDRGRADGFGIEFAVQAFERRLERRLDLGTDAGEGHRRERVLQRQQVARRLFADQIGTRRERLPQLDRRRSDRLEGGGIVGHLGLDRAKPRDAAQPLDPRRRLRRGLDPAQRAMARQDAAPLQQAGDMGDGSGHLGPPPACGRGWASNGDVAHAAATSQQAGKSRCPSRKREGVVSLTDLTPSTRYGSRPVRPESVRPSPR